MAKRILGLGVLLLMNGFAGSVAIAQSPGGAPTQTQIQSHAQAAPMPAEKPSYWGAIAFTADGSYATAWKQASKAEAEADVAKRCAKFGRGSCEVIGFAGSLCAALATYLGAHSGKRYKLSYTGGGVTTPEAQKSAMTRCNQDKRTRGKCQLRTVVCGDGR
jgi:hypothetical protein